jgi:phosphonatase-like hydrolase
MNDEREKALPIELACLDMAGTTVRDDGAVEKAFLAAFRAVGIDGDDPKLPGMLDYVKKTMGNSKIAVFEALFPDNDLSQKSANAAFEKEYDAIVARGEVQAMPGAYQAIAALRSNGIKVALLTGFSAATRDRLVGALAWEEVADLLVSPVDAGRGRPYPDMVLHAILALGIDDVSFVAVVGDTAADMESGRRAGASIVAGVLSGADDRSRLMGAGATVVLEGISELPGLLGCT